MSAMLEETENVRLERPGQRPPTYGLTIVARPSSLSAEQLLERLREAWGIVSSWGRWSDEELGGWPEPKVALAQLPDWARLRLAQEPGFELDNWFDDLHDRDWIWWSGAVVAGMVKLDVEAFSMPVSLWPLKAFVEWAGGEAVAQKEWTPGVD